MTLGDMLQFVKAQYRENMTDLDTLIKDNLNHALRKYCRKYWFPQLRENDAELTLDGGTADYYLPYNFDELIPDSVRYDVTATSAGQMLPMATASEASYYRALNEMSLPACYSITGGGSTLYSAGTASISNRGTAVTGSGTTWTSDHDDQWMIFSGGSTGRDYGYLISAVTNGTSITLATPYRGPDLSAVRYEIRPANSKRFEFMPAFTDTDITLKYSYRKKPARLYNEEDVPEVEDLSEVCCWEALLLMSQFHNRLRGETDFLMRMRREALVSAIGSQINT